MINFTASFRSGLGVILQAWSRRPLLDPYDVSGDYLAKPEKSGHPPSKCYGAEPSCHSDSW